MQYQPPVRGKIIPVPLSSHVKGVSLKNGSGKDRKVHIIVQKGKRSDSGSPCREAGYYRQSCLEVGNRKEPSRCVIMLELCGILEIDVNELLTGEHITMNDYKDKAEENLLEMSRKVVNRDKLLLQLEIMMVVCCVVLLLGCGGGGAYLLENGQKLIGTILIVSIFLIIVPFVYLGLRIEHDAGYYECPNCGERYVPSMKVMFWAPHIGRVRKMTCPHCGKNGYHKKVLTKNKD